MQYRVDAPAHHVRSTGSPRSLDRAAYELCGCLKFVATGRYGADFLGEDKAILQDVALLYRQAHHR